jgi:hypothetical protein
MRYRSKIIRKILNSMETVRLSRRLATIRCDVPIDITPETVRYRRGQRDSLVPLCTELGFSGILEEIPLARAGALL